MLTQPRLQLTEDTTTVLDARIAKKVVVTVPDPGQRSLRLRSCFSGG
jgi:hypothetical protein